MTELDKLIKAAQVVIDEYSKHGFMMTGHDSGQTALANLRQALGQAKSVSAEPVGMKMTIEQSIRTDGKAGQYLWWKDVPHGTFIYTTPPSIDALIAEIDGLGQHTFPNQSDETFVRLKKLKGITDKYRSK